MCIDSVDWHVGAPVFFSVLSNAHTFKTGSLDRSSYGMLAKWEASGNCGSSTATVTSNEVPSICFIWVIEPASCALNDLTTLKAWDSIRTTPSELPRKTLSEPEHTQLISFRYNHKLWFRFERTILASKTDPFSPSSGGLTCDTSKKLNVFHYLEVSIRASSTRLEVLPMSRPFAHPQQCFWPLLIDGM